MNEANRLPAPRILVVDDLPAIHEDFRKIFVPVKSVEGLQATAAALFGNADPVSPTVNFDLDCAPGGQEALAMVEAANAAGRPYAVAFVDMRMPPGWDGLETTKRLWAADADIQVVICTAYSDHTWSETLRVLGDSDRLIILKKPFESIEVLQLAHALSRKWELARAQRDTMRELDEKVRQRTAELCRAEERFENAFAASPLAQVMVALDNEEIIAANAALADTFAIGSVHGERQQGTSLIQYLEAESWKSLLARLRAGENVDQHPLVYRPSPSVRREIRCSARRLALAKRPGALCVLTDITDTLALEQQFLQAQKMEAIGQLAAGVAHDFNNLLTVILTYSGFAAEDPELPRGQQTNLANVLNAATRAASLTRQLLLFSRRQLTKTERIGLNETIRNLRQMLSRVLPERIQLDVACGAGELPVLADETNIEHALMNLVVNARDAIQDVGRISLTTEEVLIEQPSQQHPDARGGRFARIVLSDTGSGIPPELLPRIFEPFFTTKPVGQGTGLGLSTVHGIIRGHGGWITVTSHVGQGTTFSIYLPICKTETTEVSAPVPGSKPAHLRGNGERILIVEDDHAVRMVAVALATRAGYHITAADDGPTALTKWEEARGNFDLLVTDIVMPNGMNGIELAQRLRASSPRLNVVFTTGYSGELLQGRPPGLDSAAVVLKPYSSTALLGAIRAAIGVNAPEAGPKPARAVARPEIAPMTRLSRPSLAPTPR